MALLSRRAAPSRGLRAFLALAEVLRYGMCLVRIRGRREVVRWRIHTAYGESGRLTVKDLLDFGDWRREMRRYRKMSCFTTRLGW